MIAPARAAAFAALTDLTTNNATLGDALAHAKTRVTDARDRALVNEIVTGTLRHRLALDYQLSLRIARRFAKLDAAVLAVLRMSAFQLLHLTRVPASAIVNDAVGLVRTAGTSSASGLVNAVLRRLARERDTLTWPERPATVDSPGARAQLVEHLSTVHSHPAWLVERWLDRYGETATESWLAFDNLPAALTLAANAARISRDDLAEALAADEVSTTPTRVAMRGLLVTGGSALTSRAFRDGLCLVQDEASQLVADVVPVRSGDRILDACASPGGKTVALAASAGPDGVVVATDVRARRVRTLRDTLERCHVQNARIVHIAADGPLPFADRCFARVLVDAPCSGLGTLRRDPDIRWRREPGDFAAFADAQLRIVERVAPLVAPGGHLVYSTCSSEPEENEAVVQRFLESSSGFTLRPPEVERFGAHAGALVTGEGFLRTLPFRDGLEAFFVAVLQRDEASR
jgi:16S rRNA (cytosine967-C5)-methyltransferase